jgi:hypothetical protein
MDRVLITDLAHLEWAFPLLKDAKILGPWLVQYFKRRGMTSLFLENSLEYAEGRVPTSSLIATTVDNLLSTTKNAGRVELRLEHSLNVETVAPGTMVNVNSDLTES